MNTVQHCHFTGGELENDAEERPFCRVAAVCYFFSRYVRKVVSSVSLTPSLPHVAKGKFRPDFQISFCKILKKKIAPCVSTGRDLELSFEWSHHRISSTDSKVKVTLQNSIIHSGSERVKALFTLHRTAFAPARKPCRIGICSNIRRAILARFQCNGAKLRCADL